MSAPPSSPPGPGAPPPARDALAEFRRWFWRPPRAHGEIDTERRVSFLELFYDLVYVVVIAQAAHTLAGSVTPRGYLEFLVVFGLIWVAWANGTLYYELHGREDGRTRTYVFVQMAILALLAVFTGSAATSAGAGAAFAVVFIAFLAVMTWLWYTVRRQDRPEYMPNTARYLVAMVVSMVVMAVSVPLAVDARLVAWGGLSVAWLVLLLAMGWSARGGRATGVVPTDSMVERFDLLVIIVLGEVVTGVVNGVAAAETDVVTLATGALALLVGFGLWWLYFDVGGRRLPRAVPLVTATWILSHIPIAVAIVGAGAAMAGLIEHAHEPAAPAASAWLLGGSVAMLLLALAGMTRTLADYREHAVIYRPLGVAMGAAAVAALVVAWSAPPGWLLALLLAALLAAVWVFAVVRLFKTGTWTVSQG